MEQHEVLTEQPLIVSPDSVEASQNRSFITANTVPISLQELKHDHLIPVFCKDMEPVISQNDFIEAMLEVAGNVFCDERILNPVIRASHPIKGRVPDAKDKPVSELTEMEKTLYYDRLAFMMEIPTISDMIGGNEMSLSIGGVKSYAVENLYNKKGVDEHFKIFIGFQNKVCLNMCVWTDGLMSNVRVNTIGQLKACISTLLQSYNYGHHLFHMKKLCEYSLTEKQFALLIGRCRLYQHLQPSVKADIPHLMFGDNQINAVCKDYFRNDSFCRNTKGQINLWKLYNLFTGANKSSYIDNFMERSVNAFDFVHSLRVALDTQADNWYLN